jgi:Asp-tRNA(Asn)/Glu-tRNA(Gln) amidotransferase A subunit family amidase
MRNRFWVVAITASCVLTSSAASRGQGRREAVAPRTLSAYEVVERSIEDLQRALQAGEVTSRQLVDAYLARVEAYDRQGPSLNAIAAINAEARAAADVLDRERAAGRVRGTLHGIPILVKDNYETIEMPTTAGSIALATFHPRRDAYLVQRLKTAGAVILGKTNMHELAAGITTVGSGFGQTRNPYDLDRNPGGSSGGTGAAIAASFAAAGMGSDTCGSIRNPASHNNLVGLRGTQGLSSRTGIVPLSSTQDIGGPIARTMADLALLLDATVGPDAADRQTAVSEGRIPASYRAMLRADALKGARLGVVRSLFGTAAEDQEVGGLVNKALDALKAAGADVQDVAVPGLEDLLRDSSMINADFKFDLAEYLARAEHPPVRSLGEILDRGLYHTALEGTFRARNGVESRDTEQSRRARVKQAALRHVLESVIQEHRLVALVYPTLRRKPARIGDGQAGSTCQVSAHSGLPALGVPAGFTTDGLPVGIDLLGSAFSEAPLLSLGFAIEQTLNLRRPPFSTPGLVGGRAPAPRHMTSSFEVGERLAAAKATRASALTFTYDETIARLQFTLTLAPPEADALAAIWVHAGTRAEPGAARHRLYAPGAPLRGEVILSHADRTDLANGRLLVRVFTHDPSRVIDLPLTLTR